MNDIILIVDNSYSVLQYTEQYLKTINTIIDSQRELDPNSRLFLSFFNEHVHVLHVAKPLYSVKPVTFEELAPKNLTAMYDSLNYILDQHNVFFEKTNRKPPLVVILTDGEDTCSMKVKLERLALQIAMYKTYGWKFIFLGCTEKSVYIGKQLGCNVNIVYNTTERSFNTIPLVLYELRRQNVAKDADFDIRDLEAELQAMEI